MASAEWLDHYIGQGIEHFYILHTGRVNDILRSYVQRGLVKIFSRLNSILTTAQKEAEWLLCCDSDTLISLNGQKIVDTLISLPVDISVRSIHTHRIYRTRDIKSLP
jgi:hypothetical protein